MRSGLLALGCLLSAQTPLPQRTWVSLEARFVCGDMHPMPVELLEGAAGELVVPAGCPREGERVRLELACPGGACRGTIVGPAGVLARLEERKGTLTVSTQGERRAGAVSRLALAILRKQRGEVHEAPPAGKQLLVSLEMPGSGVTAEVWVAPGAPGAVVVNGERIRLDFEWLDASHVALTLSGPSASRWERKVAVGQGAEVPCAELALEAKGVLRLTTSVMH